MPVSDESVKIEFTAQARAYILERGDSVTVEIETTYI
ncbi:hypothetical protein SPSYN_02515 [Sporotomaculum syntrophicum]|uniref:Uncharacterized protein n=2 Tax=Sporotomaculum syntrophicum TaxID=182264 RepID=A0A9D2WNV6_9FIRM|nr:hypothetical protein SPSYN_02515 [Sporotomaculum syntrophicum]